MSWDPIYCCVVGDLNRRHRLDVLMEKWKDAVRFQKQAEELHFCRLALVTHRINAEFEDYWNDMADDEDSRNNTICAVAECMQMYDERFFFKNRWKFLDLEGGGEEDMYGCAIGVAALSFVAGVSVWDIHPDDF